MDIFDLDMNFGQVVFGTIYLNACVKYVVKHTVENIADFYIHV